MINDLSLAVVIPCFKIPTGLAVVIEKIPEEVDKIFIIDDACPQNSVKSQLSSFKNDPRIEYHRNECNKGVGGAFYTGYQLAKKRGCTFIAKLDGDGQHCGKNLIKYFSEIIDQKADFVKGNRFYSSKIIEAMPLTRLIGNSFISFMSKLSSGYWSIMDPTYGKFATSIECLDCLNWDLIGRRFTFETTLLCALSFEFSKVVQLREEALYGIEKSNLQPQKVILPLLKRLTVCGFKRILHLHFLRSFSLISFLVPIWLILFPYTAYFIFTARQNALILDEFNPPGTVAIALLLMLMTLLLPLIILSIDIIGEPRKAQNFWD